MTEAIEIVASYCEHISQFLNGEGTKPSPLPHDTLTKIKESCIDHSGKSKAQNSKLLIRLKSTVDKTKTALENEIKSLNGSSDNQDRIITLYLLNKDLYQLHNYLHAFDREKIKEAHHLTLTAIPKFMKEAGKDFKKEVKKLKLLDKLVRFLRGFTLLTAFALFMVSFRYPEYVVLLLSYPLISFVFLIPAENLWLKNIEERIEKVLAKADTVTANQAINFLKKPDALTNLWILFDEPSSEEDYQQKYIDFIVDLGSSCEWMDTKKDHLSATKDTMNMALEEAYSDSPTTFERDFLESWLETFGELQHEIKNHFGKTVVLFSKRTSKNHTYFITCLQAFVKSNTGKKLKRFLQEL